MRPDAWNHCIGRSWAGLLRDSVPPDGCVIEIGPGFSRKVGVALAELRFSGTLYLIDSTPEALRRSVLSYRKLLPGARLQAIGVPLRRAIALLPSKPTALVMNHVMDDLLLHAALDPNDSLRVFRSMRPGRLDRNATRTLWNGLLVRQGSLDAAKRQAVADMRSLMEHVQPHFIGACQYPSWTLRDCGLDWVNRTALSVLRTLGRTLGPMSPKHRDVLIDFGQNPEEWLVRSQ